jgi:hypothetical protein
MSSIHTPINPMGAPVVQGGAPLAPQSGESYLQLEQLEEPKRKVEEDHF